MSSYDAYDAPYERERRYDDRPRYETYTRERETERLKPYPSSSRDLVRHRDSELSVEEVRREFPPPGHRDTRRARSAEPGYEYEYGRRYEPEYRSRGKGAAAAAYYGEAEVTRKRVLSNKDKILAAFAGAALAAAGKEAYDRYEANQEGHDVERNLLHSGALAAAGALVGYQGADLYKKHSAKDERKPYAAAYQGRHNPYDYYSDEDDGPAKKGHKNFLENLLAVTGMGAAVKALTGGDDKSSRRARSRSSSRSSHRSSRSRAQTRSKVQKAAVASLIAGATEAFRIAKEPGGWKGEKAKRVITAAAGAGALGGAHNEGHDKKDILESVLGGLVGNRFLHGSKSNIEADERDPGRSRSRSRARSASRGGGGGGGAAGLASLAAAGLTALTAKKALDSRDRSRSRSRRRHDSHSDGSRSPPRRQRSRSRSVVSRGLAKLGIGGDGEDSDREGSRRASSRRRRHDHDRDRDDYSDHDNYRGPSRREKSRDRGGYDDRDDRSQRPRRKSSRSDVGSGTDLGDSDADEKEARKMRGKQLVTSGLAAVATIHAAHEVHNSMKKRKKRHQLVAEGKLTAEEEKKLKARALLQDAASVGVAALGIKGAISELKEAREVRQRCREWNKEKRLRHEKRIERLKRANSQPRRREDGWATSNTPRPDRYDYRYDDDYDDGYYTDGNPYSASLPAPPIGYNRR